MRAIIATDMISFGDIGVRLGYKNAADQKVEREYKYSWASNTSNDTASQEYSATLVKVQPEMLTLPPAAQICLISI